MITSNPSLSGTDLILSWDGKSVPASTLDLPLLFADEESPIPSGP